jgi:hypothetical protein
MLKDPLVRLAWESSVIKGKVILMQPVWETDLRIFGGAEVGVGFNRAGVKFGVDKYNPQYEYMKDIAGLALSGFMGAGYERGPWHCDVTVMANIVNLEIGFTVSVRFQN